MIGLKTKTKNFYLRCVFFNFNKYLHGVYQKHMKRIYLLALIFILGRFAMAQTLGIKINPGVELQQDAKTRFNIACGLYFDQKIYRFLSVSTGLEYVQVRSLPGNGIFANAATGTFEFWTPIQVRTDILEVPVDFKFLFNKDESKKCLAYFTIGYGFGEVFEEQNVYKENGPKFIVSGFNLPSRYTICNSFRLGIETHYNPNPMVNLAFGVQYKFLVMPGQNTDDSGGANLLGVYIKSGLNFLHKKRVIKES